MPPFPAGPCRSWLSRCALGAERCAQGSGASVCQLKRWKLELGVPQSALSCFHLGPRNSRRSQRPGNLNRNPEKRCPWPNENWKKIWIAENKSLRQRASSLTTPSALAPLWPIFPEPHPLGFSETHLNHPFCFPAYTVIHCPNSTSGLPHNLLPLVLLHMLTADWTGLQIFPNSFEHHPFALSTLGSSHRQRRQVAFEPATATGTRHRHR